MNQTYAMVYKIWNDVKPLMIAILPIIIKIFNENFSSGSGEVKQYKDDSI